MNNLLTYLEVPKSRKTLKTKPKRSVLTAEEFNQTMLEAFLFVKNGNEDGYTAVEFAYGGVYFVIAKLKDKE